MDPKIDQSPDANHNNAKLVFLAAGIFISGIWFLWEVVSMITYILLAYFPNATSSDNVIAQYGSIFVDGFSRLIVLFLVLIIFKTVFNIFVNKNPDVYSNSKLYTRLKFFAWICITLLYIEMAWYPVSYYLGGGDLIQALISLGGLLILSVLCTYLVFEGKNSIINKKYLSPSILLFLLVYIVIVGIYNFKAYGFPSDIKRIQIDVRRANDLVAIKNAIDDDSDACQGDRTCKDFVPKNIEVIGNFHPDLNIKDPVSKKLYTYMITEQTATSTDYSLCAEFTDGYVGISKWLGVENIPYEFKNANTLKVGTSCLKDTVYTDREEYDEYY